MTGVTPPRPHTSPYRAQTAYRRYIPNVFCTDLFALLTPQRDSAPLHLSVELSFSPAVYFPVFMSNHQSL